MLTTFGVLLNWVLLTCISFCRKYICIPNTQLSLIYFKYKYSYVSVNMDIRSTCLHFPNNSFEVLVRCSQALTAPPPKYNRFNIIEHNCAMLLLFAGRQDQLTWSINPRHLIYNRIPFCLQKAVSGTVKIDCFLSLEKFVSFGKWYVYTLQYWAYFTNVSELSIQILLKCI